MQTSLSQNVAPPTPSGVSVLVEEITSLLDRVNAIDSHFLEVRRILVKTPFDPDDDFAQYRKKHLELVWKSRGIAGRAGVSGEDFCGDLLDLLLLNTNTSKEERIRELEIAMAGWHTDGEQDSQLSQDFEELSNTLKTFGIALTERVARANDTEARLRSEIDRLDAEIARMDVRLSDQLLPVISGACHRARHSCQRIGIIPTLFVAVSMITSLVFAVVWKLFRTVVVVLKSALRGSANAALDAVFLAIDEAVDKFHHLRRSLEASGGQQDLRSQMSILEGNLRDIQLVIDTRADILGGEVTSLNDIFNMRAKIVALRKGYSPIGKALAVYARAQKT
ncbi:hypothetical protein EV363DRAFT_1327922 [Boletus edulis]|nr:hypothetical protein EV363DRAFT_1327922 [Boletus edulis]